MCLTFFNTKCAGLSKISLTRLVRLALIKSAFLIRHVIGLWRVRLQIVQKWSTMRCLNNSKKIITNIYISVLVVLLVEVVSVCKDPNTTNTTNIKIQYSRHVISLPMFPLLIHIHISNVFPVVFWITAEYLNNHFNILCVLVSCYINLNFNFVILLLQ